MKIESSRFGTIECSASEILDFGSGLWGISDLRQWMLLADAMHGSLFWLQSLERPDICLAVVDPREFICSYELCVTWQQLEPLHFEMDQPPVVMTILGQQDGETYLNLRNPIVINPYNRMGRQVVARDDRPLQFLLSDQPTALRKAA